MPQGDCPFTQNLAHPQFKSDRKRLSDAELVEALVCLANTEGGELWLGVEDDGQPTGLHADHMVLTGLPGLVAARTSPHAARRHAWWKCWPSPWRFMHWSQHTVLAS